MLKQLLGPLISQVLEDTSLKINVNPVEVSGAFCRGVVVSVSGCILCPFRSDSDY